MIDVYFSRPGNDSEVMDRLKTDVKYARKRVYISQFYLTETDLNNLLLECKAQQRLVLNKSNCTEVFKKNCVYLGNPAERSLMHHKFLIIDDVLWIGSMNMSKNARINNWENMMRVTITDVVDKYLKEFRKLYLFGKVNSQLKSSKCSHPRCSTKIEDPYYHYQINVSLDTITTEENKQYWDVGSKRLVTVPLSKPSAETKVNFALTCKDIDPNGMYSDEVRCKMCNKHINGSTLNKIQNKRIHKEYLIEEDCGESEIPADPITNETVEEEITVCLDCLYQELENRDWL